MTKPNEPAARLCPICDDELEEIEQDTVIVDLCAEHGMFFDHGEINALERQQTKGMRLGMHTKNEDVRREAYERAYYKGRYGGRDAALGMLASLFGAGDKKRRRRSAKSRARNLDAPQLDHDNDSAVPEGKRYCPVCGGMMRTEERKDVWGRTEMIFVDVCDEDGVWLDNSELEILLDRAVQHVRRGIRRTRHRARTDGAERGEAAGRADRGRRYRRSWWL